MVLKIKINQKFKSNWFYKIKIWLKNSLPKDEHWSPYFNFFRSPISKFCQKRSLLRRIQGERNQYRRNVQMNQRKEVYREWNRCIHIIAQLMYFWMFNFCQWIFKSNFNSIKLIYYQMRIENKVGKKLPQLRTGCVTGVTRIQITLFRFINWSTRFLHLYFCLTNLWI